jgi:mono/diheme cytochrome c family protein
MNKVIPATFLATLTLYGCISYQPDDGMQRYGIGRPVDAPEIARWDIDITPTGEGLPAGAGTVAAGATVYQQLCVACHGDQGQGATNDRLVTPFDPDVNYSTGAPTRTIGNYWPYATTLFDYIRRAMPHNAPGSLTDQQVYDLSAWLLFRNDIIGENDVINRDTLPQVQMPANSLFYWSDEVADLAEN